MEDATLNMIKSKYTQNIQQQSYEGQLSHDLFGI